MQPTPSSLLSMLPPNARGSLDERRPHSRGGATPKLPKKGATASSCPQGMRTSPFSRSMGTWMRRRAGKSSGSVPSRGSWRFQPQSWRSLMSRIRASSTFPLRAFSTAMGPVNRWGPGPCGASARTSRCSGSSVKPLDASGKSRSSPDSVSMVTRSPDLIVSTGASVPSQKPRWTCPGLAERWWCRDTTSSQRVMRGKHRSPDPLSLYGAEREPANDVPLQEENDEQHRQQRGHADDRHLAPAHALAGNELGDRDGQRLHSLATQHEGEQELVPRKDEAQDARRDDAVAQERQHDTLEDPDLRPAFEHRNLLDLGG